MDKFLLSLEHEGRNAFLDIGFRDCVEGGVTQKAAGEKVVRAELQFELGDELSQLLYPVTALNEDAVGSPGVLGDVGVPREENPLLLDGSSDELVIVNTAEVQRVEAEDS